MQQLRTLGVALIAIFAVAVGASASAAAAECPGTGEGVALCSGGHELEGTFAFTGKSVGAKQVEVGGLAGPTCTASKASGQLVATKGSVEVADLSSEWSKCSITGEASCKVKPIVLGEDGGFSSVLANPGELTLSRLTGNPFAVVSISGCLKSTEWTVRGIQRCKLPSSTVEALAHEILCQKSGSELKVGAKAASLESEEEITLVSGKEFSLQKA